MWTTSYNKKYIDEEDDDDIDIGTTNSIESVGSLHNLKVGSFTPHTSLKQIPSGIALKL